MFTTDTFTRVTEGMLCLGTLFVTLPALSLSMNLRRIESIAKVLRDSESKTAFSNFFDELRPQLIEAAASWNRKNHVSLCGGFTLLFSASFLRIIW